MNRAAWRAILALLLFSVVLPSSAAAYNSEEHKWIVDLAVSQIDPATLQGSVSFPVVVGDVSASIREAKRLSVAFESVMTCEDGSDLRSQDNYYWTNFRQLEYNRKIWIPKPKEMNLLQIPAQVGSESVSYSLGQLAALYGDYRRTTFCASGRCYLTHWPPHGESQGSEATNVRFGKGTHPKCAPLARPSLGEYLGLIGSGLVPPFGRLGNATRNTAGPSEYEEAGWWGDEMMRIASVNDWHFSKAAVAWYVGMHRLAMYYAGRARSEPELWANAFHYEASALHSLTDLFAFGHVVTNRDRTAQRILRNRKLADVPAARWMDGVLAIGGGRRVESGEVMLETPLPTLSPEVALNRPPQNENLASFSRWWGWYARAEQQLHDEFNKSGATVYNLRGDKFHIFGDGKLRDTDARTILLMIKAVSTSVEDLFQFRRGSGVSDMKKINQDIAKSLRALSYVPIFIDGDANGYFSGRWALYADFVIGATHAAPRDPGGCRVAYVWGKKWKWPPRQKRCADW